MDSKWIVYDGDSFIKQWTAHHFGSVESSEKISAPIEMVDTPPHPYMDPLNRWLTSTLQDGAPQL